MNDNEVYVNRVLKDVSAALSGKDVYQVINEIAKRTKRNLVMSKEDQLILGGVLGAMLHSAYCKSRELPASERVNGLPNNPRPKVLNSAIDETFIEDAKNGKIPLSNTLYFDEKGRLVMDIANTDFVNLSPYWKKDNFLAGCAAARSVLTSWEGLMHENPVVREFVEVAVANAIHEAWIARGNVYYSEYQGQVYTNQELDTAYINLPQEEKDKDLEHYKMAKELIAELEKELEKHKKSAKGGSQPGEE